ncbi:hypothetical protein Celaphus_00003719 [Cervus elaphus hippelaphus]|nr:hypothetical protein Celaphus_00003719 [Cervus elaphus hippelaphus]
MLRRSKRSREQPQPLPRPPPLLGKSPGAADAVGRSLAFNAPAASSLLQQQQLRVRASPPAAEPPPAGAALPWDQHPPPGRASLNPAPAISPLQLGGEEGSFLHFGAAANEGNLLGISPARLVSASWGGGRDQTPWGTAHLGTPEAEAAEAGAASSLGIGAGVSAPREEPPQPRRSRAEEARTMVQSHWLPCPPLL